MDLVDIAKGIQAIVNENMAAAAAAFTLRSEGIARPISPCW